MSEKFNGLSVGDRVRSGGFLNVFPRTGVVRELFEASGFEYAVYQDDAGWQWRAHASELKKEGEQ